MIEAIVRKPRNVSEKRMGILSKFVARPRGAAILLVTLILGMAGTARAATIDTIARQAILVDMTSGTTLFEKNADQRMATSSMSKVMTMFLVFERLKAGRLKMEDTLPVSQR